MKLTGTISGPKTLTGALASEEALSGGISTAPGQGTRDYNRLTNKPMINRRTVEGSKTGEDYGLQDKLDTVTPQDIDNLIFG